MLGSPTRFPSVPGLAFDVSYRPAAVIERLGGDWYDIFLIADGRIAFKIGDVCGRGLAAAVKMGQDHPPVLAAAGAAPAVLPNHGFRLGV